MRCQTISLYFLKFMAFFLIYRGIIEGSDDYDNLKTIMLQVKKCMEKKRGGLWNKYSFVFVGGGTFCSCIHV